MVVINAVVRYSREDKCYLAQSYEVDALGTGNDPRLAVKNLGNAINTLIDFAKEHDGSMIGSDTVDKRAKKILDEALFKPDKYRFMREEIRDGVQLHVYRLGKSKLSDREERFWNLADKISIKSS